ncbi:FAD dependent oxidoreductase [Amycolatopsis marina]|uniref:FAD dependent oxidoreductase n=1 Tax=Amycolatopsis marina TaxID=490629 RepID=A0A1I0WLX4_9PSEU|nr:FAD-dependent oxidoreductase [Amycolatopsis marina]SFA89554.1 FAD dependent oxidoreductase [Amycolatopsis marina]
MRTEEVHCAVTVVGGGLAGVCAAIAAARAGAEVALIQNRPVLGGNSSSEVRVWVCGATAAGRQRYARETGIIGELYLENQHRNPEGNPLYWDMVVLDAVRAEPNIALFLNTDVRLVDAIGPEDERVVRSVTGWTMGSERETRFVSPVFLDCTGDGLVGHLAGARYRVGREAKTEHDESWAPEKADNLTLGSTILFYTKDLGRPVRYIPPDIAKDITTTSIPERRIIRSGDNGAAYWWIEWGGELDTVHDNERIRDELWSVIYGIWDYIKNSGRFDAETLTLEWVGTVPGKREYRRFVGDHVLTQNDILNQRDFPDVVGYGGWSIDLHPPGGMYAEDGGAAQWYPNGTYGIPFRCLYSVNTANLLFAGRNISASHIAFGSTRVMATCAVLGEAAGTAAAMCADRAIGPRELGATAIGDLKRALLRQDAAVIGVTYDDPADLARAATVSASSTLTRLAVEDSSGAQPLTADVGLLVPADPELDGIELLLDVDESAAGTSLTVEAWSTGRPQNYVPHTVEASAEVTLTAGDKQWVAAPLRWRPTTPQNAFVVIRAHPQVRLHLAEHMQTGSVSLVRRQVKEVDDGGVDVLEHAQPVVEWVARSRGRSSWCFRLAAPTAAFASDRAVGGYARPYGGPQSWCSRRLSGEPEHIELAWESPVDVGRVELVFDDDVNEYMNNLHYHRSPFEIMPELVRDYRVEVATDGRWAAVVDVAGNRRRHRVHRLERPVTTDRLRVVVIATNGAPHAAVPALRVYR